MNAYTHADEIIYEMPTDSHKLIYGVNGRILFNAYGCVLSERQTEIGAFVYTATNMKTGKKEIIGRRKSPLGKNGYTDMAAKIRDSLIRGDGRFTANSKPGSAVASGTLLRATRHIFTSILPRYGYSLREKQIELAEHIISVADKRGVTLAESEVGTGKTHAYLIAAALIKRGRMNDGSLRGRSPRQSWADSAYMPVVVATSSIALQNAIIKDYIPELSDILIKHDIIRKPLVSAIRKGKEHYICERKLISFYNESGDQTRAMLRPFIGANAPFDLTDADSLTPYIKRRVCVSDGCNKACRHYSKCRYQKHLAFADGPDIDFLITNHNYFLADRLHRAAGKKPLLRNYQLVVIDEAHKFLSAARTMYGLELTSSEIPELAQEIHSFAVDKSGSGPALHNLSKMMTELNGKLFHRLVVNKRAFGEGDETDRFPAVMDGEAARHLKSISGITKDLAEVCAGSYVLENNTDRRDKAVWWLNNLSDRLNGLRQQSKLIHWLESRNEGAKKTAALCAVPKDLNERLCRDVWNSGIPIVLTSGTLSAGGDFTRTKETLGLNRLPAHKLYETSMPSPFDYKKNSLIYISENMPFPDAKDKNYIAAVAREIELLTLASHGHAAVLFTSYKVMGQVHALLKNRKLPFPLFRLERGGTKAIDRFKQSGNGILMAAGALWEGIDIPGDTLSMLIIVKLPFAVPDPIGDYERSLCGSMERYRELALIPDMLVKDKQGFGRLHRTERDTGCVAFLDSRLRIGRPLRARVLRSLPLCRVVSEIRIVSHYFQKIKPREYFGQGMPL